MFGNNNQMGAKLTRDDLGPGLINFGLAMLANNNGRMNDAQLIGQSGLDALAGLQARKQYEATMAQKQAEAEANKWHMDTTNGMMIDKTTGMAKPIAGWKGKPGSDMERYLAMTPEERKLWDNRELAMKLAGRAVTNVNNNTSIPYQNAYEKKRGESASAYLDELVADAESAEKQLAYYDALDKLAADGLKTGKFEEFKAEVGKTMKAFGLDPVAFGLDNVANVEAFKNLQSKATLEEMLKQKGVQSEHDAKRASEIWAQIQNTPEANAWINEYSRNLAQRRIAKAEFFENEMDKNGGNKSAARKAWRAYEKTLPPLVPDAPMVKGRASGSLASTSSHGGDLSALSNDEVLNQLNALGGENF